jgi:hypothetical protein
MITRLIPKSRLRLGFIFIGLITAPSGWAAQPPDVVVSDDNGNTAMGTSVMMSASKSAGLNTAAGAYALSNIISHGGNSAFGWGALVSADADANSAFGVDALAYDTTGEFNTGLGWGAMAYNTTGSNSVGVGYAALSGGAKFGNPGGDDNVAVGYEAMYLNDSGYNNTASGFQSLYSNTTGHQNGAIGYQALYSNTTGNNNIANGANSLRANTTGGNNIGLGVATLQSTTTGQNNLAIGANALNRNVSGSSNTAIGAYAGFNVRGRNNLDIANEGMASDNGVMRIGVEGTQTQTYIAGILGNPMSGSAVYISSTGQLGVAPSAERYKVGVKSMASASDDLTRLRPVTYHLKTDPGGSLQYGLIAEEVAAVYPDLVVRNSQGGIEGIHYEELTPLLLNQVNQQKDQLEHLAAEVAALKQLVTAAR